MTVREFDAGLIHENYVIFYVEFVGFSSGKNANGTNFTHRLPQVMAIATENLFSIH